MFVDLAEFREYFYSVIFEISDKQMQFAELKNTPKQKKTDTLITLINQSQEIQPQGLDLGRSMASNQANLRPPPPPPPGRRSSELQFYLLPKI